MSRPSENIFSAGSSKQFSMSASPTTTTTGIFSIDKVIDEMICSSKNDVPSINRIQTFINTSNLPLYSQDDGQADIKRMFNSVTPTSASPIKAKTNSHGLSTPFQKQVLQPKRRLQQNQRSPLSNISQISSTPFGCSDHKLSSHIKPISQADQFLISSTPASQNIFDSISFNRQVGSLFVFGLNSAFIRFCFSQIIL